MKASKNNAGNNPYLKTKVMTASPEELQLMLYDGAIRFGEQAREAIENKQIEESFRLLTRTQNIVVELMTSMRDEHAPEVCGNLRRLYTFAYERLIAANLEKDSAPLEEALRVLRHVRETWVMLMEKLQQERRGEATAGAAVSQAADALAAMQAGAPADAMVVGANINFEG